MAFLGKLFFLPNLHFIALFVLLVTLTLTIYLRITFGFNTLYLPVPWYYPWVLAVPQLILLLFVVSISEADRKPIKAVLHMPYNEGWLRQSIITVLAILVAIFLYSFTIAEQSFHDRYLCMFQRKARLFSTHIPLFYQGQLVELLSIPSVQNSNRLTCKESQNILESLSVHNRIAFFCDIAQMRSKNYII